MAHPMQRYGGKTKESNSGIIEMEALVDPFDGTGCSVCHGEAVWKLSIGSDNMTQTVRLCEACRLRLISELDVQATGERK